MTYDFSGGYANDVIVNLNLTHKRSVCLVEMFLVHDHSPVVLQRDAVSHTDVDVADIILYVYGKTLSFFTARA